MHVAHSEIEGLSRLSQKVSVGFLRSLSRAQFALHIEISLEFITRLNHRVQLAPHKGLDWGEE